MNGWYPRLNSRGEIVSGAGEIFRGTTKVADGHEPVWNGDDDIIFHQDRGATFSLAKGKIDDRELSEKAAGGGWIAGRDGAAKTLVVIAPDGSKQEIAGAGQPALSPSGRLIYRVGDDKVEPTISDNFSAWGDGRGRIFSPSGELTVAGPESRARLFEANGKIYLHTMTTKGQLRVRVAGEESGWTRNVGEDRNIYSDFRVTATHIEIVSNDKPNGGAIIFTRIPLSEPKQPFHSDVEAAPEAPTDPTDPEEPVPELPESLEADVRAEVSKYPPLPFADVSNYAKVLNAVAWDHRDEGWGLSVKPQGNHVMSPQGVYVAYDILHHKPSNTLWGCFGGNPEGVNWEQAEDHGDPDGRPWLAPIAPTGGDQPDPPPPPDTPPAQKCECSEQLETLKKRQDELNAELTAFGKRVTALENAPAKPLPELVARGKFYGLKLELPVVPK